MKQKFNPMTTMESDIIENNDSLGHEKISAALRSSVHLDPEDIVRHFMDMADAWMTGSERRRRDDMSCLVVKAVESGIEV